MPTPVVRILMVQASPPDTDRLDTGVEQRNLQQKLRQSKGAECFQFNSLPAARIQDLPDSLLTLCPHIVHFAVHGELDGSLLLNAPGDEESIELAPHDLVETFRIYQAETDDPVRLVVLAGCYTASVAKLLTAHVDCAVGMNDAILDEAARDHFTPSFYAALGDDRSVQNATASAINALSSHHYAEDAEMVQLYTRDGVDAAAVVLTEVPTLSTQCSQLHRDYLRSLFSKPWVHVNLADLTDRQERASLLDVYVPLPVDCQVNIETKDHAIVDWWIKRDDPAEQKLRSITGLEFPADELHMEEMQPPKMHEWVDLGADEVAMQKIVDGIQQKINLRHADNRETKDGQHFWYMEAHDAASIQRRFVLLGDPGSGKSSFLRHLVLCLAGEIRHRIGDLDTPENANLSALRDWLLDTYTPVYIELRDLVRRAFPPLTTDSATGGETQMPTVDHFWDYVRDQLLGRRLAEFERELWQLFEAGDAILLLDGLDEVADAHSDGRRAQIKTFVAAMTQAYPRLRIIITSRPHAYRIGEWSLDGFGHASLEALGLDRLLELSQALFGEVMVDGAEDEAKEFITTLRDDRKIEKSMYANPLFFTMLAALWLDTLDAPANAPRLPTTTAELYRRSVNLLLGRWTRRKAPDPSVVQTLQIEPQKLRPVLETLACTVHGTSDPSQDTTEFHIKELLGVVAETGAELGPTAYHDIPDYLTQHAGILVSPRHLWFYFVHRTFQEHLAACELTCPAPDDRHPPVAEERRFPAGIITLVTERPELWTNVVHLAADELMARNRVRELWSLLVRLCEPYVNGDSHSQTAIVALEIADQYHLFSPPSDPDEAANDATKDLRVLVDYRWLPTLRKATLKAVSDTDNFTPEQRNVAGQLLGTRTEHDTRKGVALQNGLPAMDWVPIPEIDPQTGQREFIYQENERRTEPTFWIARYPVTYAQFQTFVDATDDFRNPKWWEGLAASESHRSKHGEQSFKHWNHPRETVSWYDAIAFCRWLTAKMKAHVDWLPPEMRDRDDWRITLPTEWQWEKAARGYDGRTYPWGDKYHAGYANIDEISSKVGSHYLQKTSAVGAYPQGESPFGVQDMSGNVWEWCLNEYEQPDRIQTDGDATRVLRGGAWDYGINLASARFRGGNLPHNRSSGVGFRVVLRFSVPIPSNSTL